MKKKKVSFNERKIQVALSVLNSTPHTVVPSDKSDLVKEAEKVLQEYLKNG